MSEIPQFGEGSRAKRRARRLALVAGAFFAGVIFVAVLYTLLS